MLRLLGRYCCRNPKFVRLGHNEDLTLWDLQVDKCKSPFSRNSDGSICDSLGAPARLYTDVVDCLTTLHKSNIPLAVASRISDIAGAYQLLYLFGLRQFFTYIEIYPTGKRLHFRRISSTSGIPFEEMAFFDDDERNIRDIQKLGIDCILVENGLTSRLLLPLLELLKPYNHYIMQQKNV